MDSNSVEPISPPGDARPASARSHSPPAPSRKVIDPDGDLSLKIPPSNACKDPDHEHQLPLTFVVCSRTLSRASHIWKALLHGRYAESKPSCASSASDWVVELPDVNPKALETILNIIHSRFESLPRTTDLVSLEDLYQLTLWTYEYDLTAILRPWASVWMKSAREKHESWRRNNTSPVTSDLERLSWIASEMGDAALLDSVLRDLAIHCPVDARGNPQNNTGTEIVGLFNSTAEPLQFYGNDTLTCFYRNYTLY
ncbi:hypothetical protein CHU98_g7940 [Xylaria longipes]|nr:hypothetical protein CHU98_g7940 [Xylaria longipes]